MSVSLSCTNPIKILQVPYWIVQAARSLSLSFSLLFLVMCYPFNMSPYISSFLSPCCFRLSCNTVCLRSSLFLLYSYLFICLLSIYLFTNPKEYTLRHISFPLFCLAPCEYPFSFSSNKSLSRSSSLLRSHIFALLVPLFLIYRVRCKTYS